MEYEFQCNETGEVYVEEMSVRDVVPIGSEIRCYLHGSWDDGLMGVGHSARRLISSGIRFADVKGTGNGRIERKIEDDLEAWRRRPSSFATPDDQVERALEAVGDEEGLEAWRHPSG